MGGPAVMWIDDPGADVASLGGKVNSLSELASAGFDVPPAFGVTTHAFARFAEAAGLAGHVAAVTASLDLDDHEAVVAASAGIAGVIAATPMPTDLDEAIRDAYARLSTMTGADPVPVAVRSSGVSEDLDGASFAGQYETYLWVMGADEVIAHVRRCWASLFNPEVLTYRPGDGGAHAGVLPGMCVGVQVMVPARSAGVMFTMDPVSGDRSRIVIESCWGLGEGVVKGDVTPDRHRVDKVTMVIADRHVARKDVEYRFDETTGGVHALPLEEPRTAECSVSDDEVFALAALGKAIERHRGAPQDIEWAIGGDGALHLLQARPETVWTARHAEEAARRAAEGATSATTRVISAFLGVGKRTDA